MLVGRYRPGPVTSILISPLSQTFTTINDTQEVINNVKITL